MKKILLVLLITIFIFTGCSAGINLDNVDEFENTYKYSTIKMGKFKECSEDEIISDAKEFTEKFLTIVFNRSYKDNRTLEQETVMFADSFLENNKESLEDSLKHTKDFYKEYELATELSNVEYNNIVNVSGDAYVYCTAKVRLKECNDKKVIGILGFDGVNSTVTALYKLKLKYINRSYCVYDYERIEKDGYLLPYEKYEDIIKNAMNEEEKIKRLAFNVSKAQNDRVYYEFKGDEDYKYLSKACLAEINATRDNAKHTKDLYVKYQLSTKLEKCDVYEIIKTDAGYTVKLNMSVKITECLSKNMAVQLGFPDGVGSVRVMNYEYYIIEEDGEYKLDGSKFLG